jgi:hypothetical protein
MALVVLETLDEAQAILESSMVVEFQQVDVQSLATATE